MTACCGLDAAVFGHQDCPAGAPASLRWRASTSVVCERACAVQHRMPPPELVAFVTRNGPRQPVAAGA